MAGVWTNPLSKTWPVFDMVDAADLNTYQRDNLKLVNHVQVIKTADEFVTSSTMQDDDELFFYGQNGQWYWVKCGIIWSSGSAFDAAFAFTAPGSPNIALSWPGYNSPSPVTFLNGVSQALDYNVSPSHTWIFHSLIEGQVLFDTEGFFRFRWAMGSSDASGMFVYKNSYIIAQRMLG